MNKIKKLKIFRFAIIAVVFIAIFYLLIGHFFSAFKGLEPRILAAIVAGVFTVIVSVISVLMGKYKETKHQIEEQHRLKKIPIYEEFLEFWFKVLLGSKIGKQVSEKDMLEFFTLFTQKLILWGSDEVILEYGDFRTYFMNLANDESTTSKEKLESMYKFEEMILAIRGDVGHKNTAFQRGDILKLFINDLNKKK